MAGKTRYSDEDQARLYVALTANDGNIKKTARETGVPVSTVRNMKRKWEAEGPPTAEQVEQAASSFLTDAERVRDKAVRAIEDRIDAGDGRLSELGTIAGILDDKIHRAKGLDRGRQDVNVHLKLPSREELAELLGPVVQRSIEAAAARDEDIIDAELVEPQKALPAPG